MAKRNRLKELEAERGNLDFVILPLVNRYGQAEAARRLKLTQSTISRWLQDNHYVSRTEWMKDATPKEKADIAGVVQRVNDHRRAEGPLSLEDQELLYTQERIADGEGETT